MSQSSRAPVFAAIRPAAWRPLSRKASPLNKKAVFTPLEVTDEASWQAAVAAGLEAFGALHGLLNAAGVGAPSDIETCTIEEWRRVNDVNSLGTFLGCKSAIDWLKLARAIRRQSLRPTS